jgi:hypothetical protein
VKELEAALEMLDGDLRQSFDLIELDEQVMEHAVMMARKHGLRGADAVQPACALLAQSDAPEMLFVFLSSDDELNAAATSEGLQVENPNSHQ